MGRMIRLDSATSFVNDGDRGIWGESFGGEQPSPELMFGYIIAHPLSTEKGVQKSQ